MEALGINLIQIISYVIIFLLLYFFTRKFVKKVLDTVEKRKEIIEEGIKNAEEAESIKAVKTKEAEKEKDSIIQNAYKHADEIVEKAKLKEESIVSEAKVKSQAVLENNKAELESLKMKSKDEGMSEAKEIISNVVKKTFENLDMDANAEEKLIQESLKNIK